MGKFPFFIIAFIGLLAGTFSGMIGIGGGVVMVPMFVYWLKYSQHRAQGLSLAVMLPPVTGLAVWNYYQHSPLKWDWVFIVVVSFVVGSTLGALWANKTSQKKLKRVFGVVMLIVALKMMFTV